MLLYFFGIVEGDPAGAALELAPFGRPGACRLSDDRVGSFVLDGAIRPVVGARALPDVQLGGRHLYQIARRRAGRRRGWGGGSCGCAQSLVYLLGDCSVPVIQIIARARLGRKPAVDGHVLLVDLTDQALVTLPQQLLDAVALANIGHEVEQGGVCLIRDGPVGSASTVGHLDRDSAVIVRR